MRILVTGGAGFIGSHTVVELQQAGYDVVVLDNLCNASEKVIPRVEAITGKKVPFYKADILDREALEEIFSKEQIDAVIHFAGLKAVGESVQKPWEYYENNIAGTLTLVDVMRKHGVKSIIFSSSATVYGNPAFVPITEECPKGQCTNPYGWTKSMLEQILTDIQKADPEWNVILLRYFNPIGAYPVEEITVVRHHQQAEVVPAEIFLQPLRHIEVEVVGRLVQYQQIGFSDKGIGKCHTLQLPAGQMFYVLTEITYFKLRQNLFRLLLVLPSFFMVHTHQNFVQAGMPLRFHATFIFLD
jgi:UDP-glucose-4-epimerase GalE